MPFCTTTRWAARRWDTKSIDRIEAAPTAVLDCWGVPVRKLWTAGDRNDVAAIDNGKRFVIDPDTVLRWEHDSKGPIDTVGQFASPRWEAGQFKETIQLDRAPKESSWTTRLELPKGTQLHYQPALTPEEIEQGCERPDWCVGSYAVYDAAGCKIGHIPRPHAVTHDGRRRWFDLKAAARPYGFDLTIAGDADWLKGLPKSAYPVLVDPTLGLTSVGASKWVNYPNRIHSTGVWMATAGTLDKGYWYTNVAGDGHFKVGLYTNGGATYPQSLQAGSAEGNFGGTLQWNEAAFAGEAIDSVNYHVAIIMNQYNGIYYDNAGYTTYYGAYTYSNGLPDPCPSGLSGTSRDGSYYVTYTETSSGLPPSRRVQLDRTPAPLVAW